MEIGALDGRIRKMEQAMEQQRASHNMQREMYMQQVRKLRDTLELQQVTRSSTRLSGSESEGEREFRVSRFELAP